MRGLRWSRSDSEPGACARQAGSAGEPTPRSRSAVPGCRFPPRWRPCARLPTGTGSRPGSTRPWARPGTARSPRRGGCSTSVMRREPWGRYRWRTSHASPRAWGPRSAHVARARGWRWTGPPRPGGGSCWAGRPRPRNVTSSRGRVPHAGTWYWPTGTGHQWRRGGLSSWRTTCTCRCSRWPRPSAAAGTAPPFWPPPRPGGARAAPDGVCCRWACRTPRPSRCTPGPGGPSTIATAIWCRPARPAPPP